MERDAQLSSTSFSITLPSCQVLVAWELTPLLTAFAGWFGCGHPVFKAVPLCASSIPSCACNPSRMLWLQPGKQQEVEDQPSSLQGPSQALPTGGLLQSTTRGWLLLLRGVQNPLLMGLAIA